MFLLSLVSLVPHLALGVGSPRCFSDFVSPVYLSQIVNVCHNSFPGHPQHIQSLKMLLRLAVVTLVLITTPSEGAIIEPNKLTTPRANLTRHVVFMHGIFGGTRDFAQWADLVKKVIRKKQTGCPFSERSKCPLPPPNLNMLA